MPINENVFGFEMNRARLLLLSLMLTSCSLHGDSVNEKALPGRYVFQIAISDTLDVFSNGTYSYTKWWHGKKLQNSGTWTYNPSKRVVQFEDFSFLTDSVSMADSTFVPKGNWNTRVETEDDEIRFVYASDVYKSYFLKVASLDSVLQAAANIDTTKTVVIPWSKENNYPFESSNYSPSTLTQADIEQIDESAIKCVTAYNSSLDAGHEDYKIDLNTNDYKRQLIIVTNLNGEKEVWVNYFCESHGRSWQTQIVSVEDGGPCYFSFKLNLTTKQIYDLTVNGFA